MTTYENIKILRKQNKLSQDDLAKLTGYTDRSSIAKIESGGVELTESKIKVFADALGVSPSCLMGLSDVATPSAPALALTQDETQLITDYRDASDEIREEASGMLRRSAERNRKDASSSTSMAG